MYGHKVPLWIGNDQQLQVVLLVSMFFLIGDSLECEIRVIPGLGTGVFSIL